MTLDLGTDTLHRLLTHWRNADAELRRSLVIGFALVRLLVATAWDFGVRRGAASSRFSVRLRTTLEGLGPTFIKLGQFLAIRFDLLPFDICRSLEALFENVHHMPLDDVRRVIEDDLRTPLELLFSRFEPMPVAAASLAQVHVAQTATGEQVAVKVQRPGVAELLKTDLRIMRRLARMADAIEIFGWISLTEMIGQFSYYVEREVDFVQEGRTADVLRCNAVHGEIIPRVHWDLTTVRVLTLEFVDGISLGEVTRRFRAGAMQSIHDRFPNFQIARVLHNLVFSALHQLFVAGSFHGDPHPGNVIACADNRIALVDFGIAGHLTEQHRELLRKYLAFLALGNFEESYRHFAQLFEVTEDSDVAAFKGEMIALLRQWHRLAGDPSVPAELRLAGRFSDKVSAIVRKHRLRMSMDTLLFWRVLITLDSTAQRFSAHFDLLHELRMFFAGTIAQEFFRALRAGFDPARTLVD